MDFTSIVKEELSYHPLYIAYIESHSKSFLLTYNVDYYIFLHEGYNIISGIGIISDGFRIIDIADIRTEPGYKKKGYASKLMKYFLKENKNEKRDVQTLCKRENKAARGLFKKFGFKPITRGYNSLHFCKKIYRKVKLKPIIDVINYHPDKLELKFKKFPCFYLRKKS